MEKINKIDIAMTLIANDIIRTNELEKIKTVKEYSEEFKMSVGSIQKAIYNLQKLGYFSIKNRGNLGKYIEKKNQKKLIKFSIKKPILAVMPLPYTKRYQAIATSIKILLEKLDINVFFAYMPGSKIRLEFLKEGIYDFCLLSKLAHINNSNKNIVNVLELGPNSFLSEHVLIYKKNVKISDKNIRIGLDSNSEDQQYLSLQYFKNYKNFIEVSTNNIMLKLINNQIDAAIVSKDEIDDNLSKDLSLKNINIKGKELANIAVIVSKDDNIPVINALKSIINKKDLFEIQEKVLSGEIAPKY